MRERMRGKSCDGRGDREGVVFGAPIETINFANDEGTGRQGAGFVERELVYRRQISIATPPRNKIPFRAPAAIATKIAEGIESTNAHGDATTSNVIVR